MLPLIGLQIYILHQKQQIFERYFYKKAIARCKVLIMKYKLLLLFPIPAGERAYLCSQ